MNGSNNSDRRRSRLLRLDDDNVNSSWLDRLASPAVILAASVVASLIIAVIVWFVHNRLEQIYDLNVLGRALQEDKFSFACLFAVMFSVVYPLYDQILETVLLYQSSKISAPANMVDDLNKSSDTFIESSFLLERWILLIITIICPLVSLIYMDPTRNPVSLMHFIISFGNIMPILLNGCLLSIIRQSSNFLSREITISIWITWLITQFVFLFSNSTALRASVVVITLLAVLYPIVNSFKEHYNAESGVPSDEIDNKKNIFETRFIAAYYVCFLLPLIRLATRISPVEEGDNDDFLYRIGLVLLVYGLLLPLLLLFLNPKRLYARWQEEKIQFLHKHNTQLLEGLLPRKVIAHFRQSKETFVEKFDSVTIIFVDIMDFTVVCRLLTPFQIVLLLDAIFNQFDKAADLRGVYRVETIGDCYMASTGCPDAEDPSIAAGRMVLFAQDLIQIVRDFQSPCNLGFPLQIRIGIHSGPVVAGTLSGKMLRYCLFGDTVNTASRMESTGEVGRIHLSEDTVSLVRKDATCSYDFESRLPMHVKGKGVMSTYFLDTPENSMSTLDVHDRDSFRSNSESDEPEPCFLLKNLSTSLHFSFMGRNKTTNANSNSNPNVRKPRVAPTTSDSVNDARRMLVVPSNEYDLEPGVKCLEVPRNEEDPERGMVANPRKSVPINMAFVMASSLLSWDFDVQNIVSKDMLIDISFMIFQTSWLCGPLGVSEVTLRNFIEKVAGSYHGRSFHNFQHAVSVVHITALLMNYCNQKDIMGYGLIPSLARFVLMIAALVHDCDHPGHTNSFEVGTNSSLAQKYRNIAVLENHHLAVAESVLSEPGCNILETFDEETATMYRDLLKYIVLGTDMGVHKDIVSELACFETELDTGKKKKAIMFTLCRAILHAADLSNPVRAFEISKAWAIRLADEHTKQVQAEAALGLPPAQFMVHKDTLSVYQGEIKFLTHVAQPLWAAMAKTWPQLFGLHEQLQLNIQSYQDLISKASKDELRISTHQE